MIAELRRIRASVINSLYSLNLFCWWSVIAMSKASKKPEIELEPDAWARFESLMRAAGKMKPMPHKADAPKGKPKKPAK